MPFLPIPEKNPSGPRSLFSFPLRYFPRLRRSRGKYRRGKETNVQIRRIWTFAKKKIYMLRRPSFSLIHVFFSDPFMGREKQLSELEKTGLLRFRRNRRRRSSAVENRKRFSTAEVEKKNRRFFFSRKKDLRSFFLRKKRSKRGARSSIGLPSLKLFLPTHEWVGKNSFHLSFLYFPRLRVPSDSFGI